ncbi:MAG: phosphorybosylanthranilate isomerase [Sandaracinus sp.]|nr:phosphorybosylanthranilate isomerase [Sandaracinus sp.]|tara:strand:- start:1931 stop:2728 length:798 start_codon:yes stop_codon:yes gene_type:complete
MSALPRGLVGVVHLPPLPGDPRPSEGFDGALRFALRDADALAAGGLSAVVVENFGSAPFPKGSAGDRLPPHQVAFMAVVARELKARFTHVGINCLRNDARSALGVAAATGSDFVRVNVHTGAYVTDQGLIEGEAAESLRYRAALGGGPRLTADVLVKHAAPLAPLTATQATHEALDRGLADAVIVSGTGTGQPVDRAILAEVRAAAGDRPVWIGSGLTPANAPELAPLTDAAIVGTWLKEDGDVARPVDPERVKRLLDATTPLFR